MHKEWTISQITQKTAQMIADEWHYPGQYAFYDMTADPEDYAELVSPEKRGDLYWQVTDTDGAVIGFFVVERVNATTCEIGLGLRPDLTGHGLGQAFGTCVLDFVGQHFAYRQVNLAVAVFNKRAIRLYHRLGFHEDGTYMQATNGGHYEFIKMHRELHPEHLSKPEALQHGDHVALVSLSSGILGEQAAKHQRTLAEKRLHAAGLVPEYMPHARRGLDYLATHPEARAEDLKLAFWNAQIKGIFCAIGGDDTYRLLPYLMTDHSFVCAVQDTPKIFSGFSDTTINHLMFYRLGMQSFYGPNILNDWAELDKQLLPYTAETLNHYFTNPARTVIPSSPVWYEERKDFSVRAVDTPRVSHPETHGYEVLRGTGQVYGRLLGGCLDSLYDILTTNRYPDEARAAAAYQIFPAADEWQGKILFIETSEDRPSPALYRRMLDKLDEQGVLAAVNGIIVGKPQDEQYYADYQDILTKVTASYETPIFYNVNFGHAYPRTILPYGALAKIDLDEPGLTIEEPYFSGPIDQPAASLA